MYTFAFYSCRQAVCAACVRFFTTLLFAPPLTQVNVGRTVSPDFLVRRAIQGRQASMVYQGPKGTSVPVECLVLTVVMDRRARRGIAAVTVFRVNWHGGDVHEMRVNVPRENHTDIFVHYCLKYLHIQCVY